MVLKGTHKAKTLVQDKAVNLLKYYNSIVLEWATGCGKTLASLRMVDNILSLPGRKGLIVFKESTHKQNWLEDIRKHNMEHILEHVELKMYASLHKVKSDYYDFIVMDECHAITWKRLELLKRIIIPTTKLILLSATIPEDKKYLIQKLDKSRVFKYAQITLAQAIHLKILPAPVIYVHKIELSDKESIMYRKLDNKMNFFKRSNMFGPIKTTGLARKNLIANSKTGKALSIILDLKKLKKRHICFTGNIEQALSLGGTLVSSRAKDKKANQILINNFNFGYKDELMAVKMLREGMNLVKIDSGVIIQLDKEPLPFYQMLGRCLRSLKPELHMIICKNTHDEVYFDNVMDETLLKYVKYV